MNPDIGRLQPYPFERLAALKSGLIPPADRDHIALSIGEPKHPTPALVTDALIAHLHQLAVYPNTRGIPALRETIAAWLSKRFKLGATGTSALGIDPEAQILPVNGTREALFAFAQAVIDRSQNALVLMPNPFYQIYEGAAFLAGAQPRYLACEAANGFRPGFRGGGRRDLAGLPSAVHLLAGQPDRRPARSGDLCTAHRACAPPRLRHRLG
jgi:N-succinyldiaminopimelate aminotransferase